MIYEQCYGSFKGRCCLPVDRYAVFGLCVVFWT